MTQPEKARNTQGNDRGRPQWLVSLVRHLERGESQLTMQRKRLILIVFTLIVGSFFLHLAISGLRGGEAENQVRQVIRPPHMQVPPPQPLLPDSIHPEKFTP